jgi:hypothetical protein
VFGLKKIEIPSSVQIIDSFAFKLCVSLQEICFAADSQLRVIRGFCAGGSFQRFEIPSSVEMIDVEAFYISESLHEVIFPTGSCIRKVEGFRFCDNLSRIGIPEDWGGFGFPVINCFEGLFLKRRFTKEWSILLNQSDDYYLIDEPLNIAEFSEIAAIVQDGKEEFRISKISDRLMILSGLRSIPIPSFITTIGSCFDSMNNCLQSLIIPS